MAVPGGGVQTTACLGSGFCVTVKGFQIQMAGLNRGGSTDPGTSQESTKQQTNRDRSTAEVLKTAHSGKAPQTLVTRQALSWAGSASSSTPTVSIHRTLDLTT